MNIWHPFERIPDGWPMLAAFVVLLALAAFTAFKAKADLKTPEAPNRAISLELAGTERQAKKIIGSWDREGMRDEAYRHLRWDNLFIPCYSTLAALVCIMAARAFFRYWWSCEPLYSVALIVAWLPWAAGLSEYVENVSMYFMVGGFSGEALPRAGWLGAAVKFVIMIPVTAYTLFGLAAYVAKWVSGGLKPAG
ncbi:MAG TPA: hypothetical protein VGX48_22345 [Pyrinomonadaceae bacterium]|jgi:hypothetical protein|nr:hypothetical protein [Pyrinomonadaceae bacterium]